MNTKNIILIASVLIVLGLLGGIIFGALTLANALLIAPAILGVLYGIYERFEKNETERVLDKVVSNNIQLESQITSYSSTLDARDATIKKLESEFKEVWLDKLELMTKLNESTDANVEVLFNLDTKTKTCKVLEDNIIELRSKLYDAEISNQIDKASTTKLAPSTFSSSEETNNKPKTQRRGPRKESK
mgnify:CR=1 FL=1